MRVLTLLIIVLLLTGCVTRYSEMNVRIIEKPYHSKSQNVEFSYSLSPFADTNNMTYQKKADKNNFTVLAVKVNNNSDFDITLRYDNLTVKTFSRKLMTINPNIALEKIKKRSFFYLLYALIVVPVDKDIFTNNSGYIWLPIGLPIGCLEQGRATLQDNMLKKEIMRNFLIGKTVKAHSEEYGYLIVSQINNERFDICYEN